MTLFLVFIVAPVVELGVFLWVASLIGIWPAVALQLALSLLGVWVLKRAGTAAFRRTRATMSRGEVPTAEVGDGLLHLLAGVLLLVPGFVTAAIGLLLLVPPVRAFIRRRFVKQWMVGRRVPGFLRTRSVIDVEWVGDVTPRSGPGSSRAPIEIGPTRD